MKNKLIILLALFLIVPLISANGLFTSNQTIFINKTYGVPQDTIVTIRNADTFAFYNITIDTPTFSMNKIDVLAPNMSANITVTIATNDNYVGKVKFKGYYLAQQGMSNETIPIVVDYTSGPIPCSFSIVKGDTLVWNNTDTKSLDMINSDTSSTITTIPSHTTYFQTFTNPLMFNYHFTWLGFDFGYCSINVLGDTGYITNQDYDALADFNIKVDYKPTILNTTFLETNYTMNVLISQDGLFLIKNTGTETAKNITLSGNWFKFSSNNFDLAPDTTKTLSYTINPAISTTNQTNKTYIKSIQITGNFPTIVQNFTIFVNYADVSSSGIGYTSLEDMLKKFCIDNPSLCSGSGTIIYRDANDSGNLSQEQFRKIMEFWSNKFETVELEIAYLKEQGFIVANQSQAQTEIVNQTSTDVAELKQDRQDSFTFTQVLIVGIALFIVFIGGGLLIQHYKKKKRELKLRTWN